MSDTWIGPLLVPIFSRPTAIWKRVNCNGRPVKCCYAAEAGVYGTTQDFQLCWIRSGIDVCVGQLVARLEGDVMLSSLTKRIAKIEITGESQRLFNNTLRGLDSFPVMVTPT